MFIPIPIALRNGPRGLVPPRANSLLIALNVLLYALGFSIEWGVSPGSSPLTVLTYGFIHAGPLHLLGNMWLLWLFGNAVNRRLGDELYAVSYLGIVVTVGLFARFLSNGILVGSSGGIYGVIAIATLLIPASRIVVGYVALFPVTLLLGLWRRPQHWLGWLIRWDRFELLMLWASVIVPLIEILNLLAWRTSFGVWHWTHLAHLLGFVFGVVAVVLLPSRVSMRPSISR